MQETWDEIEEAKDLRVANHDAAICDADLEENGDVGELGVKPARRSRKQKAPRRKNTEPLKIPRYEVPVPNPAPEPTFPGFYVERVEAEQAETEFTAIAPEQGLPPLAQPSEDRLRCEQEASQMVHDASLALGDRAVKNPKLNDLVSSLTALMLQIKTLAKSDMNSYGFKSLNDSLEEIKKKIDPSNLGCFQNNVEVHVAHIQSGMSQMGNLHAFAEKNVQY